MKNVLVLGCTGSIGSQTLDIIRSMKDSFRVCGASVLKNKEKLSEICSEFNCKGTVFSEEGIEGTRKLIENSNADIVVNGISGSAGLLPSIITLENKIDLALANKETVVMAWPLVNRLKNEKKVSIIPVDSEHSAIFNLTQKFGTYSIDEIVITASGGPFRNLSRENLENVTVEQALKHPTWNMGKKITIDSATLANKGLEVIEACRLFDFSTDRIKVVVHPQSLIHSLVRTKDGMLYAQISNPDMRHPIYGALVWPDYKENYLEKFDLCNTEMTFFKPRYEDFPMLKIAYECAARNGGYTIAYNAANEIAVKYFLDKKCRFYDISNCVQEVLKEDWTKEPSDIEEVLYFDSKARKLAENFF